MPFVPSRASLERPGQTVRAMAVLGDHAEAVARACADASPNELILAAVNPDLTFAGVWTIPSGHLGASVEDHDERGWLLLFSPRASAEEVVARCRTRARLASLRWVALQRLADRQA
jgi:hypothetical protein